MGDEQDSEDKNEANFRMEICSRKVNVLNILLIQMLWKEQKWLPFPCCCIPWQIIFCLFVFVPAIRQFDCDPISVWQQDSKQSYAAYWGSAQYFIRKMKKSIFWLIPFVSRSILRHRAKGPGSEVRHLKFKSRFHQLQAEWSWTGLQARFLTCEKYAPYCVW